MKKLLVVFTLLFCVISNAQETDSAKENRTKELMSKKVEMDVDSGLFMAVTQNTFVSESPKAVIMGLYVPETYENIKLEMDTEMSQQFKVVEKGEKTINGVSVLCIVGISEPEGITMNNTVYCYKVDADTCVMLMGIIEEGAENKYKVAINKALNSGVKKH